MNIHRLFFVILILTILLGSALFVFGQDEPAKPVVQQVPNYSIVQIPGETANTVIRYTDNANTEDLYSLYEQQLRENNRLRQDIQDLDRQVRDLKKKNSLIPPISPGY